MDDLGVALFSETCLGGRFRMISGIFGMSVIFFLVAGTWNLAARCILEDQHISMGPSLEMLFGASDFFTWRQVETIASDPTQDLLEGGSLRGEVFVGEMVPKKTLEFLLDSLSHRIHVCYIW